MALTIEVKPGVIYGTCKELDISRDALARLLGFSTATLYRLDAGKVDPSPPFIAAFINRTGKSFDELFTITGVDDEAAVPA